MTFATFLMDFDVIKINQNSLKLIKIHQNSSKFIKLHQNSLIDSKHSEQKKTNKNKKNTKKNKNTWTQNLHRGSGFERARNSSLKQNEKNNLFA